MHSTAQLCIHLYLHDVKITANQAICDYDMNGLFYPLLCYDCFVFRMQMAKDSIP
ncbi:hypothetical protein M422DRAFT_23764 [Sphaerobolus stellatus SS14]|nr:hypothetical protein M422DRAFT_23764 [Sphaerobolus stellatus SS14]